MRDSYTYRRAHLHWYPIEHAMYGRLQTTTITVAYSRTPPLLKPLTATHVTRAYIYIYIYIFGISCRYNWMIILPAFSTIYCASIRTYQAQVYYLSTEEVSTVLHVTVQTLMSM